VSDASEPHAKAHGAHAEHKHRDRLAAVASALVALVALVTSVYGAYVMREQVYAGVTPRLVWATEWKPGEAFVVKVTNRGVGAAEVKRVRVFVDDAPMPNWAAVSEKLIGRKYGGWITSDLATTFAPSAEREAWSVFRAPLAQKVFAQRNRLTMELCYCSTFDSCWVLGGKAMFSDAPRAVPGCEPDAVPFQVVDEPALEDRVRRDLAADAGASKAGGP
jgi:hypothetical protein